MAEWVDGAGQSSHLLKFRQLLSLLRVSHWSKAVFVFLGFFYTNASGFFLLAFEAAFAFCLISSAVYIYNDLQDREEDSLHPHKCKRPIASEQISVSDALFMLFLTLGFGLLIGWYVSPKLAVILGLYLFVNIVYNHVFKLIPILDVSCIAFGFMLRVLAGTVGIGLAISSWLIIAATLLSLFIALNKRRLEMHLSTMYTTRCVLKKYNKAYLDNSILGVGVLSFITYFLYTVFARNESFYFLLTLPFACFAIWRFGWLTLQNQDNDDPVYVFLNDKISRVNLGAFVLLTFMALVQ